MYKDGYFKDLSFIPLKDVYFSELTFDNNLYRTNSKPLVLVYGGIAFLILIVAILNYVNMTVSQLSFRGREVALKRLHGCGSGNLVLQFLGESFLMTAITFFTGLFLAFLAEPFFNDLLNTDLHLTEHPLSEFLSFSFFLVFLVSGVSGAVPSFIVTRFRPIGVVKGVFSRNVKIWYAKFFVVFQYVVGIALLICSFFVIRQTSFLLDHDLGFDVDRIFIMDNVTNREKIAGLRDKLSAVPGVEAVSFSSGSPFDGGDNCSFSYEGRPFSFQVFAVDSSFFDVFRLQIRPTGIPVSNLTVWVNQKGIDVLQPDSVSLSFDMGWDVQIAGVIDDFNFQSLYEPVGPMFIRYLRDGENAWNIFVRFSENADLHRAVDEVRRAYSEYTGGIPFESFFADDTVQKWYEKEVRMSKIMVSFTLLIILILIMGVFAMSLYQVRQREKEIAIRKVNGATENEILQLLNLQSVRFVAIAFFVAVPMSYFAVRRWLSYFAYRIELDWWVFLISGFAILFLSLFSISWQSRRAARANPVDSLKGE